MEMETGTETGTEMEMGDAPSFPHQQNSHLVPCRPLTSLSRLSCAPSWSQFALMSMWRNSAMPSTCRSVSQSVSPSAAELKPASRHQDAAAVWDPQWCFLAPSVTPYPTQQGTRRTAILAQHHHRSDSHRHFLRKRRAVASGPHTSLLCPMSTHSLHYRCISAE